MSAHWLHRFEGADKSALTCNACVVGAFLARLAHDPDHPEWPGQISIRLSDIAAATDLTIGAVSTALSKLWLHCFIRRRKRYGGPIIYEMRLDEPRHDPKPAPPGPARERRTRDLMQRLFSRFLVCQRCGEDLEHDDGKVLELQCVICGAWNHLLYRHPASPAFPMVHIATGPRRKEGEK